MKAGEVSGGGWGKRRVLRALVVGLLTMVAGCAWAAAAQAASAIEVLGGKDALTLELSPAKGRGGLHGKVTLVIRNGAEKPGALRVSFVPAGRGHATHLSRNSRRVSLEARRSASQPFRLKKKQIRAFIVRFNLPPGAPPSAAEGELILRLKGEGVSGNPTVVPVTAAPAEVKNVTVEPATLVMDSNDDTATVTLRGAGLVPFLRSARPGEPSAILHDDAGHTAKVNVALPAATAVATSGNPTLAEATLEIEDGVPPGKYTGKVPLSSASGAAPTVELELHSHRCFALLVLLAFAGVLFGGLLTRLVTLAMRRSLLLKMLEQSLGAYRHVLGPGASERDIASWHLADLLEEPAQADGERLQGVPGLIDSIETARSSRDLDEDADRVLDTVARIQRWLRLEPAARRLKLVAAQPAPEELAVEGQGHSLRWEGSETWRDSQMLLAAAGREPTTVEAADDLLVRLLWQAQWHHRFARVWGAVAKAEDRGLGKELLALDALPGDKATIESLKDADRDVLDARLQAFVSGPAKALGITFGDLPKPPDPSAEGITPVRWSASPNLFTGWATLDKQSYGQLSRRAVTSARAIAWPRIGIELKALGGPDLLWTLVTLVLASLFYGLSSYSNTWGTTKDLANAFIAGFIGTVVVDWAALPIFQSVRLRAAKKD